MSTRSVTDTEVGQQISPQDETSRRDAQAVGDRRWLRLLGPVAVVQQYGSNVTQVVTTVRFGDVRTVPVYLFQRSHPADAYRITVGTGRASGLSGP